MQTSPNGAADAPKGKGCPKLKVNSRISCTDPWSYLSEFLMYKWFKALGATTNLASRSVQWILANPNGELTGSQHLYMPVSVLTSVLMFDVII